MNQPLFDVDQPPRPKTLLSSNSNLRPHGILNWTIPALVTVLPDGRTIRTCPSSGVCARACYARAGAYMFSNVLAKHQQNLAYVLDEPDRWAEHMVREIRGKRAARVDCAVCARSEFPVKVRIHDAGDFFSDPYTLLWRQVIEAVPQVLFYAYTKEVDRVRRLLEADPLPNCKIVFSFGGTQDAALDPGVDRVCDVFPTVDALTAAGYHDQAACDLLAVVGPTPVGMGANNIRHLIKRQGDRSFRTWQAETDRRHAQQRQSRTE